MTNTPVDKDKLYALVDQIVDLVDVPEGIDHKQVSEIHLGTDSKHGDHALSVTYFLKGATGITLGRNTVTKYLRPFNYRDSLDFDTVSRD